MSLPLTGAGPSTGVWTPANPTADGGKVPHTGLVPGLAGIYQDSAETTSVTADGDPIGAMNNVEIGVGTDAYSIIQAVLANKPTYKTGANGLDGLPVVSLDGGDFLQGAFNGGSLSQPLTIIMVFQLDNSIVNDDNGHVIYDGDDSTNRIVGFKRSLDTPDSFTVFAATALVVGDANSNWNIWMTRYNGASSVHNFNGSASTTSGNPGSNAMDGLTIGAGNAGASPVIGKLAYYLIYSSLLSVADLNQIGNYLTTRFPSLSYTDL